MTSQPDILAAVDLGSNSFHMIIARMVNGQLNVIDRIKDMVRLGGGLDANNALTDEARQRALDALSRFGERISHMPRQSVRIVGTNTLRKARNTRDFLKEAQKALGHPIEIVSGREEARLIYLGVAQGNYDENAQNRLVIDIGGGSTEVIVGNQLNVLACESLYMGCVSFSQRFFPGGRISKSRFQKATLAARQELRAIENVYPNLGWAQCFGASGTIKATQEVILQSNIGPMGITYDALCSIRDQMIEAGHIDDVKFSGLKEDRQPVFAGGIAILLGLFESLGIQRMDVSDFAMREGVLFDLHGRINNEDTRDTTIDALATRYLIDEAHAERVAKTALELFDQVSDAWSLDKSLKKRLQWACHLHEIGLAIAHSRYHKHSSYIVENSDMAGFSRQDHQLLWALVRTHRRQFKPHRFDDLPGTLPEQGQHLCVLLRLAVLFNRSRVDDGVPPVQIEVNDRVIDLRFEPQWLDNAPLTRAELEQESEELLGASYQLNVH